MRAPYRKMLKRPERFDPDPALQALPIGSRVQVLRDDGHVDVCFTRSSPWQLSGHTWVVQLAGESGSYALERVTPIADEVLSAK